jgi:hypothetical protein
MILNEGTITSIKRSDKSSGLDDLFGYTASDIEETKKIYVVDSNLAEVFDTYNSYLGLEKGELEDNKPTLILTPNEIDAFLQETIYHQKRENFCSKTSRFLSGLIQNSYDFGNNGFNLNFTELNYFNDVGRDLCGKKDEPIELDINGNIGNATGSCSKYLTINVNGNVGHTFGFDSTNMTSAINGDVGLNFGESSYKLAAQIEGNVRSSLGINSNKMKATIKGEVDPYSLFFEGKNAILKLHDKKSVKEIYAELIGWADTYRRIYHTIFPKGGLSYLLNRKVSFSYNKLIQVNDNGKEKLIARFLHQKGVRRR